MNELRKRLDEYIQNPDMEGNPQREKDREGMLNVKPFVDTAKVIKKFIENKKEITTEEIAILTIKDAWYSRLSVQYELVKQLKDRELSFLPNRAFPFKDRQGFVVRYLKAFSLKFLNDAFNQYNFKDLNFRLYKSLALWHEYPTLPYRPLALRKEKAREVLDKINYSCYGFDFAIDLDRDNFNDAKKDALKIAELFNKNGVPFHIQFSGKKGFHLFINWQDMVAHEPALNALMHENIKDLLKVYIVFAKSIEQDLKITLDYSIYTLPASCLIKLAYSLDWLNNDFSLVKPISLIELRACKQEDFYLKNNFKLPIQTRRLMNENQDKNSAWLSKTLKYSIKEALL